MLRAAALTLTCASLALGAAACGQSESGGDADPATLVPAGAALYVQAAVQPTGDQRADALAAAGKIMRTDDPGAKLRELIDEELAEEGDGLSWERDFASWLGEDAGVWAANLAGDEPSYAVIVASRDIEAAKAAIARFKATDAAATYAKKSHNGSDYEVDEEGTAVGVVDDFVVIGSEDAYKRTADMAEGGERLADADRYKDAIDGLDEHRLGHYYMDVGPVVDAALEQEPESAAQFEQFKSLLPLDKLGPITGSFQADGEGMALDTVMTGVPEGPFRELAALLSGGGTELLGELPGDAWGAFAAPQLGKGAETLFDSFAGALGGAAVAGQVKQATGLDLRQDVFAWIGDVGMFVRGVSEPALDGALVIQATDDTKAANAFGKLVALIGKEAGVRPEPIELPGAESAVSLAAPGAEQPVVLARGAGRVIAAYGKPAATAALDPDTKLRDAASYGEAKDTLEEGMEPSLVLSLPEAFKLAEAMGASDADYKQAKPYLEALGVMTSGGKTDGDRIEFRLALTLK